METPNLEDALLNLTYVLMANLGTSIPAWAKIEAAIAEVKEVDPHDRGVMALTAMLDAMKSKSPQPPQPPQPKPVMQETVKATPVHKGDLFEGGYEEFEIATTTK